MKPEYENISISEKENSFKFFRLSEPYFRSYWHFHPEMELTYIMKGEGMRYVGDSIEAFGPGDLVLLGKNIPHNWESFQQTTSGVEALVIQFPESILEQYSEFNYFGNLTREAKWGLHFNLPSHKVLNLIEALPGHDSTLRLIKFWELLYELKALDQRKLSSTGFDFQKLYKRESRINSLKAYIDMNICTGINIGSAAAHMQMTESYFCRWFKRNTGNTLVQYLNKLKVEMVCRELIYTDRNISEIAYDKGFENISHFNRVFKELKKVSPREYRNNWITQ